MILTNKYNVDYNIEAIDRDFDIYVVEKKSAKLDDTNVLDIAIEQYKARAVQYSFGRKAFVLFEKNIVTENEYREAITKEYEDVTVRKMDIFDEKECEAFFYKKRLLAQLLMNSIRVPKYEIFSYNNLSGKLFYGEPNWRAIDKKTNNPYMLYFVEIRFDRGMYLNLSVKTFMTKQNYKKKRCYLIDSKTGYFRKKLSTDVIEEDKLFIESSFESKKNTIKYFDFETFDSFKKCKLGILEQFTQDVEKYLGEYITLTPGIRDGDTSFKISKKEHETLTVYDYTSILSERGINIVDECHDDLSEIIVGRLVKEFGKFYGITAKVNALEQEMYNIRIIHNEEYYKENELLDPHNEKDLNKYIIQHVTLEECNVLTKEIEQKESPIVHKLVEELILKGDVRKGKISIYNWNKLSNSKEWTFITREKIKDVEIGKEGIINSAGNKVYNYYKYVCIKISQTGDFKFYVFDDMDICASDFEEKIRFAYDTYFDEQKLRHQKYVEGLVFSSIENIHVIIKTNEKTMPNIRNLWNGLKETNDKEVVPIEYILNILDEYLEMNTEDTEYIIELKKTLQEVKLTTTITKKNLRKFMKMKKGAAKRLNRSLHEHYGIWISPEIKNQDFEDHYLLENVLNIKYFEDNNTDGTGEKSLNYYVGPTRNSLKSSIHNASIVRQVQAEEEIEFKELLPLMAVDFVRIGMYSVLPFPFKYLREYLKML